MKYQGGCHCGKVSIEVEGELTGALSCNCSWCSARGSLLWFVPRDKLTLRGDEADLATYTFHKHVIRHRFCRHCGVQPFSEGKDGKGHAMAAINIRCLEGLDLAKIPVREYDGRSL